MSSNNAISWVVGRGGLLGRNVERALGTRGAIWHPPRSFTWHDSRTVERELSLACRAFAAEIGNSPWQIAWSAGAGVVASGSPELDQETRTFAHLLKGVTEELCRQGKGSGAMFVASSAGGVYAGSKAPPFCEDSPVAPIAPYGWAKLEQESLARQWSMETGTPLLVGRLSNLYGPGQKLWKPQGLITQMCLRIMSRQSLVLYVPLDTIRDYLFAKDAGQLVADGLFRLRRLEESENTVTQTVVKIFASQQPATVSTLLAQLRSITKRPLSVLTATSPIAWRQPRDLRMTSSVWTELDRRPTTSLGEGIRSVLTDILDSSARGYLNNRLAS